MKTSSIRMSSERGAVLITAMIVAFCMAAILAAYLSMTKALVKTSNRNLYLSASLDLAETGVEQAMWALNKAAVDATAAWSGWTVSSGNASRKFSGFTYETGNTGYVNVYVANYASPGAVIVARAVIRLSDGQVVEKWIKGTLKGRSLFEYGLLARDKISAEGGCIFDSWISDPDGDPSTAAIPYSSSVARSNGGIAAGYTGSSAVTLKPSAKVYGKVSVGTASGPAVTYGSLGTWPTTPSTNSSAGLQQDWGTVVGEKGSPDTYLQAGYLITDFKASFEQPVAPSGATVKASYTLPYFYDDPATTWNDNQYIAAANLGTAGTTSVIQMEKLTVKASGKLTIKGNVTLILPTSGVTTFEIIEGGSLSIAPGSSLTIYTPGNIKVTGGASAGVVNSSSAEAFQIWSTRPLGSMGQTISLEGSGSLQGVIYAPDAVFSAPGGTNFFGSAIVYSATLKGSGSVHYDESLKNFVVGTGSVAIQSYAELTTPQSRADYTTALAF